MLAVGGASFNVTIFINIEMHGIAFSMLFFWIIPAVLMSSVIGVSQTEESIRRVLDRFHKEIEQIDPELTKNSRLKRLISKKMNDGDDTDRWFNGGLYSWHSTYWQSKVTDQDRVHVMKFKERAGSKVVIYAQRKVQMALLQSEEVSPEPLRAIRPKWYTKPVTFLLRCLRLRWLQGGSIALLCVLIPSVFGMILSSLIPPDGFNCRVWGELGIFLCWFLSHELDIFFYLAITAKSKKLFWAIYAKDLFFTLATFIFTFMTILGIFNRCSCWLDDDSNLILPQRPDIGSILRYRLKRHYPALIFSALAIELIVIPFGVFVTYYDALLVYVQRDDGKPNVDWFQKRVRNERRWQPGLQRPLSRPVRKSTWKFITEGRQPAQQDKELHDRTQKRQNQSNEENSG